MFIFSLIDFRSQTTTAIPKSNQLDFCKDILSYVVASCNRTQLMGIGLLLSIFELGTTVVINFFSFDNRGEKPSWAIHRLRGFAEFLPAKLITMIYFSTER